jgi:uncharacterized protein
VNRTIDPTHLINKYYACNEIAKSILLNHSQRVSYLALSIAKKLEARGHQIDLQFISEAALLHDIGMLWTNVPELGCYGELPYLAHGIKGAEILNEEGYPRHARVCERHIGVGLTATEIAEQHLPLPQRDMLPETLEEKIICYADLFFSKGIKNRDQKKSLQQIRMKLKQYGQEKVDLFDHWHHLFEPDQL